MTLSEMSSEELASELAEPDDTDALVQACTMLEEALGITEGGGDAN